MSAMRATQLGRTGERLSVIGLGTWQWGAIEWGWGVGYGARQALEALDRALELGVTWVDTAEIYGYGRSESLLGKALRDRGDEVLVATKAIPLHNIERACEGSLRRLGVDAIDLYQVHWPVPPLLIGPVMKTMERLKRKGRIRHIGVSNFSRDLLRRAREALPRSEVVSNQVKYNLLEPRVEESLLPDCREAGVTVIAYSPLAQGALSGKYGPDRRPRDWVRRTNPLYSRENLRRMAPLLRTLRAVARKHRRSVPQVALNWAVRDPRVVAIPGAKSAGQAEENARGGDWRMGPEDLRRIEEARRRLRLSRGPLEPVVRLFESLVS